MTHGGAGDTEGHVGDLGNILADNQGVAHIDITSKKIQLSGPFSVLGCVLLFLQEIWSLTVRSGMNRRTVVVHTVCYFQPTLSGINS